MKHIALTPFGRAPATLAQVAAARTAPPCPAVDKWTLYARLRTARVRLGVSDRDLGVLHALLSFLPERELRDGEPLVVYPSNATLSDRAHGMPESTLRRHLAALVRAGLVARRDSPNGKRYAARSRAGELVAAYGFDLRSLLLRAPLIEAEARAAEAEAQALRARRAEAVVLLRDASKLAALLGASEAADPLDGARSLLRRQLGPEQVAALVRDLSGLVDNLRARLAPAEEMSGNDGQNERHQQSPIQKDHDPIGGHEDEAADAASRACHEIEEPVRPRSHRAGGEAAIPLALVLKACPELLTYAEAEPRSWRDLAALAEKVRGYMGIASTIWVEARSRMGPDLAAATVAVMLQRFGEIRNPGGYLRRLVERHAEGRLNLSGLIFGLLGRQGA
ncbi:plasmid replication protein RepC [Rubellimicrobium aerolatum]|uniref:Plasmid replication protein RepC n=1 Tax=Rubellimicrobium aerolatum TaxID=490979 RepID=A0ABW0SGQ6_9RHOB|nr:plasmid replication protein RepC [Rubellimicrobium aerolatum]MBP1807437.1 replication initiation protein RepC [Rubellimicrobium aerolatum]